MKTLLHNLTARSAEELESYEPSAESLVRIGKNYRILRAGCRVGLLKIARFTSAGFEHIPRTGPVVILTNHAAHFDALHVNYAARRPVIFLASASVFTGSGPRGRFLHAMGMVPKRKFTPDTHAIRTLKGWINSGAALGVFPEGERSWDGEPLEMFPGIGKLVRFLGAPVVTGRIHNGDRHWPRWAVNGRWGRVHVEFDPVVTFGRRESADVIERHIAEHIRVPTAHAKRWPVWGRNLAAGLSNLIFVCPVCDAIESTREQGNELSCIACGAQWRIDVTNLLRATGGPATDTTLPPIVAHLQHLIDSDWIPDPERFARDGIILESKPGRVLDQSGHQAVELCRGRLMMTPERAHFEAGAASIPLPFDKVRAITIEERRRLWIMTADRIFEMDLPGDSIVKWGWMLKHWYTKFNARNG